jgi:hypothetical protein
LMTEADEEVIYDLQKMERNTWFSSQVLNKILWPKKWNIQTAKQVKTPF